MKRLPAHHTVVAYIALFVALGGTATAVSIRKNSIGSAQIKPNAVKSSEISRDGVTFGDLAPDAEPTKLTDEANATENLAANEGHTTIDFNDPTWTQTPGVPQLVIGQVTVGAVPCGQIAGDLANRLDLRIDGIKIPVSGQASPNGAIATFTFSPPEAASHSMTATFDYSCDNGDSSVQISANVLDLN